MRIFILSGLALFLFMSCSSKSNSNNANGEQSGGIEPSCSLKGQYVRCSTDGQSSVKVTLLATKDHIEEVIEEYQNSDSCSGIPSSSFNFNATYALGEIEASNFVKGGTDVDITPDVDIFGCGANQPGYTVLKFEEGCGQFYAAEGNPSCSPLTRPNTLDPNPFVKQ